MVGLPVQAGCGDEAGVIVSTGIQQNQVTGKGLVFHDLHYIAHLQSQHKTSNTTWDKRGTNTYFMWTDRKCSLSDQSVQRSTFVCVCLVLVQMQPVSKLPCFNIPLQVLSRRFSGNLSTDTLWLLCFVFVSAANFFLVSDNRRIIWTMRSTANWRSRREAAAQNYLPHRVSPSRREESFLFHQQCSALTELTYRSDSAPCKACCYSGIRHTGLCHMKFTNDLSSHNSKFGEKMLFDNN